MISLLCGVSGCASLPFMGPRPASTPATPIFFQPASAALDQPALSSIESAAEAAQARPGAPVYVTGAADSIGPAAANQSLSQARAQAVAAALAADGVAATRIHTDWIGESAAPAPDSRTQAARRVLIRIGD
jgi:outer membrane protein OmpA-like peptidoglycan-associated protein